MKAWPWMLAATAALSAAAVQTVRLRSDATESVEREWLRQALEVPVREAREVLRHGDGADVPDWAAFVHEPSLMLDSKDRLYVSPGGGAPRVRVLDEDGAFVRYVGRRGNGPGEFMFIGRMGLAGDTLWIMGEERTSFFDMEGVHLKTEPTVRPYPGRPRTYGLGDGWTRPLGDGRALYGAPHPDDEPYERENVPLMVGPRTTTGGRDTVAFVPSPRGMAIEGVAVSHSFPPVKLSPLYSPLADGQGVAVASWTADKPGEVALRYFGLTGEVSSEHVLGFPVRELSPKTRERFIDEAVDKTRAMWEFHRKHFDNVPSDLRAAVVDGLKYLPDHYSPVDAMFATQDDRIWLRATVVDGEGGDWYVVGPEGRVEFRVRPPPGVSFEAARRNRVWGVGKGYLDVAYIALYELLPPQQGKEGTE